MKVIKRLFLLKVAQRGTNINILYTCTLHYLHLIRLPSPSKMQTMPNGYRRAGPRPGTPCPSAGQCRPIRPGSGHSVPSAGLRPALRAPVQASAGLRPALPCPSAGRAGLRPGTPSSSAGLRPALRPPNAGKCRPSAFGRHSVPLMQTSAGFASVSPMPRVTECTCRPHCRCRPSGLHQALVTYRV